MKIKMIAMLTLTGFALFLQSCATLQTVTTTTAPGVTSDLTSLPSNDQKMGYDGTLFSQKKHSVSLSPYIELDDAIPEIGFAKTKLKFMLTIKNGGENQIHIGPGDITVVVDEVSNDTGKDSLYRRIKIQSFEDVMVDFEKEYNEKEMDFVYSTIYNVYNLLDNGVLTAEDAEDEMWDFRNDLSSMRNQLYRLQETLPKTILADKDILPDRSYTGVVICDTGDSDSGIARTYRVTVSVDGEEHLFTFHKS